MYIAPNVVDSAGKLHSDIYSRLLEDRIVFIVGYVGQESTTSVISQLLFLDSINNEDIKLYINSEGGEVSSGLAVYDVMQSLKSTVTTVAIGNAASMGSLILQGATKHRRFATKYATIVIHQPRGGSSGTASAVGIHTTQLLKCRDIMGEIYARHNSRRKTKKQLISMMRDDCYFSTKEAIDNGLIDGML